MESKIAESMMNHLQNNYDLKIKKMDKNDASDLPPKQQDAHPESMAQQSSGASAKPAPTMGSVVESLSLAADSLSQSLAQGIDDQSTSIQTLAKVLKEQEKPVTPPQKSIQPFQAIVQT